MLITIATVCYNDHDALAQTIANIRTLDFEDKEYIVIDGGSGDGTQDLITDNQDIVDVWKSEPDRGLYHAMNKALSLARGEWIIFMNAGDQFANSDTLNRMAPNLSPNADVLYGDRWYLHKSGKKRYERARHIDTIFERMPFCHQSALVKTATLRRFAFNETYRFAADYELFVRMYVSQCRFEREAQPISIFVAGGLSESGLRPHLEVMKVLLDYCDDTTVLERNAYLRHFRRKCHSLISKELHGHNDYRSTVADAVARLLFLAE